MGLNISFIISELKSGKPVQVKYSVADNDMSIIYKVCSNSSNELLKSLTESEYDFTDFTKKYLTQLSGREVNIIVADQSVQFIP